MSGPRVVIGIPTYNKAPWLGEALDSLLVQTYDDLAIVVVDDCSDDDTVRIAQERAALDSRLEILLNPVRLGMLGNTNRALRLAQRRFESAVYCALGSDHDVWDARWLETLVGLLDADPRAVLAYPLTRRIDEDGAEYPRQKPPWRLDTAHIDEPRARLRQSFRGMAAGDMIYGLFRIDALARVGVYRPLLVPDRLLLSELALLGTFIQAPEVLWRRRYRGLASLDRQRRAFFLDRPPRWTFLPWWVQHTAAFAWSYGVAGKGLPARIDRAMGLRLAADYLVLSLRHRAWRRARRLRHRLPQARNAVLAPLVRAMLRVPWMRRVVRKLVLPALREAEDVLERHTTPTARATLDAWRPSEPAASSRP